MHSIAALVSTVEGDPDFATRLRSRDFQTLSKHSDYCDGRLYFAKRSTRIYCRPLCSTPVPRAENGLIFADPAVAEQHGFRPCLRCRPELAPGLPYTDSMPRVPQLIRRRIVDGYLYTNSDIALGSLYGLSVEQLGSVILTSYGVSLVALAGDPAYAGCEDVAYGFKPRGRANCGDIGIRERRSLVRRSKGTLSDRHAGFSNAAADGAGSQFSTRLSAAA